MAMSALEHQILDRVERRMMLKRDAQARAKATTDQAHNRAIDPVGTWKAAVADLKAQGIAPSRAVSIADQRNPGLRQAMLAAVNAGR
ncbi:hypothetical protein [Roseiconus lacunae]|uniref:Uncharacterized protein n=1 Tax=Roseiconus lacunae TaxID=2605694 RepID=A0ABT7PFY1_9BACT|nr:hypothetical protein [Roseiconus lacunae]MDM4015278.1 hypothetical protein [Roseiconus lacunae]